MPLIEYWPIALVASGGLIAWGEARAKLRVVERDVETKASKESVERMETRLERIEDKLDRLMERAS